MRHNVPEISTQSFSSTLPPTESCVIFIFSSFSTVPHHGGISQIEGRGVPLDCMNHLWLLLISVVSFRIAAWCDRICRRWTQLGQCYSHRMALWNWSQQIESLIKASMIFTLPGPYASFLEGQGHPGVWGNWTFLLGHFKGTKALTRGHGGNHSCCLR